jgi:hypothetical protein
VLPLLPISLVWINTLMIQRVLAKADWMKRMKKRRFTGAILIWAYVNPFGTFRLDVSERLQIDASKC